MDSKVNPTFGPDIARRFQWASSLDLADLEPNYELKEGIKRKLSNVLKDDGLLLIPTAPGEAPLLSLSEEEFGAISNWNDAVNLYIWVIWVSANNDSIYKR